MYYGARYYSTTIGRFISADTIVPGAGNPQTLNRFAYTLNNPLKYMDPTGHCSVDGHWMDDTSPACTWIDNPGGTSNNGSGGSDTGGNSTTISSDLCGAGAINCPDTGSAVPADPVHDPLTYVLIGTGGFTLQGTLEYGSLRLASGCIAYSQLCARV